MAEATHDAVAVHGLRSGIGKGPKIWAGQITVSDGETLDTGFDVIDGGGHVQSGAPDAATFARVTWESIAGGIITFGTGVITTAATTVTDAVTYMVAVGSVR